MTNLTDIHNRLSNTSYLHVLWLLYKFGDIEGKDIYSTLFIDRNRFSFVMKSLQNVNLIESHRSKEDGRDKIFSLKKDYAAVYAYTLFMISEDPEIKEIEKKFLGVKGK